MNPFAYERATRPELAIDAIAGSTSSKFLAGGTNLVDLMKNGVETPDRLVDINRLALAGIERIPNGGLRLGAVSRARLVPRLALRRVEAERRRVR